MSRPSRYTQALALDICTRVALGESLTAICSEDVMPVRATVYNWIVARPEFAKMYAKAREQCADSLFTEALDVARNASRESVAADRLRVDTLKWCAARLKPWTYSDKIQVEHQGAQEVKVVVEYADDPPPAE